MEEEDMLRRPQMNWEKGKKKMVRTTKTHGARVASFDPFSIVFIFTKKVSAPVVYKLMMMM
jgi:hypothetical protein